MEGKPQSRGYHSSRWYKKHPDSARANKSVPEADPTIQSTGRRLLDFFERPLFTVSFGIVGGVAGLVFSSPILLVCGVCVVLAFHRAEVVKGKPIWIQLVAYLTLSGLLVVGLYGLKVGIDRKLAKENTTLGDFIADRVVKAVLRNMPQQSATQQSSAPQPKPEDEFNVSMAFCQGASGFYWVRDSANIVYPVDVDIVLNIINAQSMKVARIRKIAAELKRNDTGKWMELKYLPVDIQTGSTVGMTLYWGALPNAQALQPESDFLETLQRKQFQPGESSTVGGFFEFADPNYRLGAKDVLQFRVTLTDIANRESTYLLTCGGHKPSNVKGNDSGDFGWWDMKTIGGDVDISQLQQKRLP